MELEFTQSNAYNYSLVSIIPRQFNTTTVLKLIEGNPNVYLSKGDYRSIGVEVQTLFATSKYRLIISDNEISIEHDSSIEYRDDFKLELSSNSQYEYRNRDQNLPYFRIVNGLGQRASNIDKVYDTGVDYSYELTYAVTIEVNGKEYTKKVNENGFNSLKFKDIIGEDELTTDFTFKIDIPEIPIIEGFEQVIKVSK